MKIIFNYSESLLDVPPEVTVHTSSPAVDLLYALYFYLDLSRRGRRRTGARTASTAAAAR